MGHKFFKRFNTWAQSVLSKTFFHIVVGGIAFVFCSFIILINPKSSYAHEAFTSKPQFLIWLFLFSLQFSLWVIIALPLFKEISGLMDHYKKNKLEVITTFISTILITAIYIIFFAFIRLPKELPLAHHRLKVWPLTIIGLLIALLAATGIWLVHIGVREIAKKSNPNKKSIEDYLKLRKQLKLFLSVVAVLLGLGTLTIGALRHSLIAYNPWLIFDAEVVLLYGAYFSFFMALVYVPTRVSFYSTGKHLSDSLFPMPDNLNTWDTWYLSRKQFEDYLELNLNPKSEIQSLIAILTPFGSALITLLK